MAITLQSTRFGDLELSEDDALEFPDGLVGLPGTRYALLLPEDPDGAFAWLQSLDDASLALPVTRPGRFFPDFDVVLEEEDVDPALRDTEAVETWVVVRAGERLEDFSANLRAPLLIVGRRGWQVINRADEAPLRAPLVAEAA
ncbi:flagellar assembly protein FliW [Patulibacter americanus]|uniref:flagellar assembly protein FliW n=1 Tax=Patulibacter americanus TaxID=588672 RepID=UPI0003B37027|nr:flagellar assembly protein FliW [Patulibacter americanus]